MKRNWSLLLGVVMLGILLFFTYIGPNLPFVDPAPTDSRMRFYEDGSIGRAPFPPSKEEWFGTDRDGRDMVSLIILGAKDTLKFIFFITIIRYLIGVPLAFLASNKKGLSYLISNGWNALFSSVPTIFAAMIVLHLPFVAGKERASMAILMVALIEVGRVSHIFSNEIYELSKQEYIKAAITVGNKPLSIYVKHILPNLMPNLIVNFFNDFGRVTLLLGQLALFSYFIVQSVSVVGTEAGTIITFVSGTLDWQSLLAATRGNIISAVWIPLFPSLALTYTIFTFYLLGEGLRHYYNLKTSSYRAPLHERIGVILEKIMNGLKRANPGDILLSTFYIGKYLARTTMIYVLSGILIVFIVFLPGITYQADSTLPDQEQKLHIDWEGSKSRISGFFERLTKEKSFGFTKTKSTVESEVARSLPRSVKVLLISFFLVMVCGVLKGVFDFMHRHKWSRIIGDRLTALIQSFPDFYFLTASMWLILFFFPFLKMFLFAYEEWYGFILPALLVSLYPISYVAKVTLTALQEEAEKQYVQVAHAKGFQSGYIVFRHMLQNAFSKVLSNMSSVMILLLSNLFILELFLDYKGAAYRLFMAIPYDKELIIAIAWIFLTIAFITQLVAFLLRYYFDPTLRRS